MTIFTTHEGKESYETRIGRKAFIGTNAVIGPNITIGPGIVIEALACVSRDCLEPGIYVGVPAKRYKRVCKLIGFNSYKYASLGDMIKQIHLLEQTMGTGEKIPSGIEKLKQYRMRQGVYDPDTY